MKKTLSVLLIGMAAMACRVEITPQKPPTDPPKIPTCKPLPILTNIVGTWQFKKIPVHQVSNRIGTITFNSDRTVTDPDSLFDRHIDGYPEPVVYKKFSLETSTDGAYAAFGEMLWVRSSVKERDGSIRYVQGNFHQVIVNECNRIELLVPGTHRIFLTR